MMKNYFLGLGKKNNRPDSKGEERNGRGETISALFKGAPEEEWTCEKRTKRGEQFKVGEI